MHFLHIPGVFGCFWAHHTYCVLPANFAMGAPKIARDFSGARSGNPKAWLVFLGISEHGPRHFRKSIRGDLRYEAKRFSDV